MSVFTSAFETGRLVGALVMGLFAVGVIQLFVQKNVTWKEKIFGVKAKTEKDQ